MKKSRIWIVVFVMLALLIPVTVQAAGTFYCSSAIATGGDGTFASPWACQTQAQLDDIIDNQICALNGGGVLFRILDGSYQFFRIEIVNGACTITDTAEYAGSPPNTGALPLPLILAIAAGAGALMLGVGFALRKQKGAAV